MQFLAKKLRLLSFLTARVPGHGWGQWQTGLRDRRVGYAAMELAHILPPQAEFIVDVGGHHGEVSAALDLLYAPKRLCVVEPNPELTEPLKTRFARRPHISVVPQCLGEAEGTVSFNLHEFDAASSLFECRPGHLEKFGFNGGRRIVSVLMTTLQRLLAQEELPRVDLLKMDCQGAELGVLRGAGPRLQDVRWIYSEVAFDSIYAGAPLFGDVHRFLIEAGFELHHLGEFAGVGSSIQWGDALYFNSQSSA